LRLYRVRVAARPNFNNVVREFEEMVESLRDSSVSKGHLKANAGTPRSPVSRRLADQRRTDPVG
jgi:hypothetical protein